MEPSTFRIAVGDGVHLDVSKTHFELDDGRVVFSERAVHALDGFVRALHDAATKAGAAGTPAASGTSESHPSTTTSIEHTQTSGTAGPSSSAAPSGDTHEETTLAPPRTAFGALRLFVQLSAANMRFIQRGVVHFAQSQTFSWVLYGLVLELCKHGHSTVEFQDYILIISKFIWAVTAMSAVIDVLKWTGVLDTYRFIRDHMFPDVYDWRTRDLSAHAALIDAAARIHLEGSREPDYDAIVGRLVVRPPIYQQLAIIVSSILPWVLREWKEDVENKREVVLKRVKRRVEAQTDALRAEAEKIAKETNERTEKAAEETTPTGVAESVVVEEDPTFEDFTDASDLLMQ